MSSGVDLHEMTLIQPACNTLPGFSVDWGAMHEGKPTHRRTILLCTVVGLLLVASCSSMVGKLSVEWRDWGYVQRCMGGVTLGEPRRHGDRVTVPVELHYERATVVDSALVPGGLRVATEGMKIWITLSTRLAGGDRVPLELSFWAEPGEYEFGYKDPSDVTHILGTIRL